MPFKSRAQKIAASARRFEFLETAATSYQGTNERAPLGSERKIGRIERLPYVRYDLVKIGLLAALVVAGQILLSFVRA
ncbi:MAG: hypothetical protein AAB639_00590 [Patescibacteria group bacterium]